MEFQVQDIEKQAIAEHAMLRKIPGCTKIPGVLILVMILVLRVFIFLIGQKSNEYSIQNGPLTKNKMDTAFEIL